MKFQLSTLRAVGLGKVVAQALACEAPAVRPEIIVPLRNNPGQSCLRILRNPRREMRHAMYPRCALAHRIVEVTASCPGAHVGEHLKSDHPTGSDRPRNFGPGGFRGRFPFLQERKGGDKDCELNPPGPRYGNYDKAKASIAPVSS
jgi:hypothetical protein